MQSRFKQTYEGLPVPAVQDEVARFLYLHHHGGMSHISTHSNLQSHSPIARQYASMQAGHPFLPAPLPADSMATW